MTRPSLSGVPTPQAIALHMCRNSLVQLQADLWLARQSGVTDGQLEQYLELGRTTLEDLEDEDR